jgi:hypothetical protein
MHIEVSSDDNIQGSEELFRRIEEEIEKTLGRFSDQITRIEVHLGDENGAKSGDNDKRCLMEARLARMDPEAVTHHGNSLEEAWRGAAKTLQRILDKKFSRLRDHKGAPSIRTGGEL